MTIPITIVIPTHNRYKFLAHTVRACQLISPKQIVILDSSTDEIPASCDFRSYSNITHIKNPNNFTAVDNFNTEFEINGEYIVWIGDDDLVTDYICDAISFAKKNRVDCITFSFPITYRWPDFRHRSKNRSPASALELQNFTGRVKKIDTERAFVKVLNRPGMGPLTLPRAYCGVISKSYYELIISKYGKLFGGVSPDIYSSIILSAGNPVQYMMDIPAIVPGISGGSTSGLSSRGQHVGDLYDNPHMAPFKKIPWRNEIPKFYAVQSVWAFSLLLALDKILRPDARINYVFLYIEMLWHNRLYYRKIFLALKFILKKYNSIFLGMMLSGISNWVSSFFERLFIIIRNKARYKLKYIHNIESTYDAATSLAMLRKSGHLKL